MSLRPVFARLRASARLFSQRIVRLRRSLQRLLSGCWGKPRAGLPLRFRLTADPCESRELPGSLLALSSFPGMDGEIARPSSSKPPLAARAGPVMRKARPPAYSSRAAI